MTKMATNDTVIQNVMIDGQAVPLGGDYTVAQAKEMISEMGLMTDIANASAQIVNPGTIEFINTRGENGTN